MRAYLGLGSNLGDRRANIAEALKRLGATHGIALVRTSSVIETEAVGGPTQPRFLNAACEIETDLSPWELLRAARRVERGMGRVRRVCWGPRTIDIDILLIDELVIADAELSVPHPRMTARAFVLGPLAEIAPRARHPVTGCAIGATYDAIRRHGAAKKRQNMRRKATKTVRTRREMRRFTARWRAARKTVGLVPTMGALHEGHLSLIRRSVAENDRTVVWIFVNPTQFGPGEDLPAYPRRLAADVRACRSEDADVVFAPHVEEVYPDGFQTFVEVEKLTKVLCGRRRPTHFRGVTTVCAKMFAMVCPDRAYFGEKDYQQLVVVRRMAAELDLDLEIVACPIVREADGLAISSRNRYLSARRRTQARVLFRALVEAKRLVEREGTTDVRKVRRAMRRVLRTAPAARVDYVEIVHPDTLESMSEIRGEAVAALAVFLGQARLIDNMKLRAKGAK